MRASLFALLAALTACAPLSYTSRMLANVSTDIRSQTNPAIDSIQIDTIVVLVENVSRLRQGEAEEMIAAPLRARGAPTTISFASLAFMGSEAEIDRMTLQIASRRTTALLVVREGESGYDEYQSRGSTAASECATRDLNTGRCTRVRTTTSGGGAIYKPYGGMFARLLAPHSLQTLWMAEITAAGGGFAGSRHVTDAIVRDLATRLCTSIRCQP